MATQAYPMERCFKVEKFYGPLFEDSDKVTSGAQQASPELILTRLRELIPLLAFTKTMVIMEEQLHGR